MTIWNEIQTWPNAEIEIEAAIIKIIDFYGELSMGKLIEEMQIRGVKETKTRIVFQKMIDKDRIKVDYSQKLLICRIKK